MLDRSRNINAVLALPVLVLALFASCSFDFLDTGNNDNDTSGPVITETWNADQTVLTRTVDGQVIWVETYTRDSAEFSRRVLSVARASGTGSPISFRRYAYDGASAAPLIEAFYDSADALVSFDAYARDADGDPLGIYTYDENSILQGFEIYSYTLAGNFSFQAGYRATAILDWARTCDYDTIGSEEFVVDARAYDEETAEGASLMEKTVTLRNSAGDPVVQTRYVFEAPSASARGPTARLAAAGDRAAGQPRATGDPADLLPGIPTLPAFPDTPVFSPNDRILPVASYDLWSYDEFGTLRMSAGADFKPTRIERTDTRILGADETPVPVVVSIEYDAATGLPTRKTTSYGDVDALILDVAYDDAASTRIASLTASGASMFVAVGLGFSYDEATGYPDAIDVGLGGLPAYRFDYEFTDADTYAIALQSYQGLEAGTGIAQYDPFMSFDFAFAFPELTITGRDAGDEVSGYWKAGYDAEDRDLYFKSYDATNALQSHLEYGYADFMPELTETAGAGTGAVEALAAEADLTVADLEDAADYAVAGYDVANLQDLDADDAAAILSKFQFDYYSLLKVRSADDILDLIL